MPLFSNLQYVRIRHAPGRYKDVGPLYLAAVGPVDRNPLATLFRAGHRKRESDRVFLGEQFGEFLRYFLVLVRKEPYVALEDLDFRPHGAEEMRELARDIPAADDDEFLREHAGLQRLVARHVGDLVQPLYRGDGRAGSCGYDNPFGGYLASREFQRLLPGKDAPLLEQRDVLRLPQVSLDFLGFGIHRPRPLHDFPEVYGVALHIDSEYGRALYRLDDIRAVDEYLRRDAATVEAGAPHRPLFHDGDVHPAGGGRHSHVQP